MVEDITSEIKKNTSDKTYKRALSALPILVRQVLIAKEMDDKNIAITYGELGDEIDAHHRTISHVLYCIERLLEKLSEHWEEEIPSIQGIVINQDTLLPGNSVEFLRDKKLDTDRKKELVKENITEITKYPKWTDVLEELGLPTPEKTSRQHLQSTAHYPSTRESDAHKQLKNYVAKNPKCVEVEQSLAPGDIEYRLPSGDMLDVLFENKQQSIAVEVKSHISNKYDILRGLFQCVKYRAILEAQRNFENATYEVDARLAIEGKLPKHLRRVKDMFEIKVFENIKVPNSF